MPGNSAAGGPSEFRFLEPMSVRSIVTLADLPAPPAGRTGWPWTVPPPETDSSEELPPLSLVTPSFNQAQYIEETIRSVLLQGYPRLDYVVIDGGSTDGTVEILRRYSPWISHWESERDRGQSHAINKGLARTRGAWVNWINSDDYLLPGALLAVGRAARANPEAVLVAGQLDVRCGDSIRRRYGVKLGDNLADDIVNHRTAQPAMFYRSDFLRSVDESLHYAMDYDLWVRLLSQRGSSAVRQIPETLAVFREHPDSKTSRQAEAFEADERTILRRLCSAPGAPSRLAEELGGGTAREESPATGSHCIDWRELSGTIFDRHLAGDLRRAIAAGGLGGRPSLLRLCLGIRPLGTAVIAAKGLLKKHIFRRAA
jgi:hypothetical protein